MLLQYFNRDGAFNPFIHVLILKRFYLISSQYETRMIGIALVKDSCDVTWIAKLAITMPFPSLMTAFFTYFMIKYHNYFTVEKYCIFPDVIRSLCK